MPVVNTVHVTSFVQFDGDQTTAVHTRTIVEISEDGNVFIEDSAEIDNATEAVCVCQCAQVDTEHSQMLLHSTTQQEKPQFDPKAPANDITVEQSSDLIDDDDSTTKEARTFITINPADETNKKQQHGPMDNLNSSSRLSDQDADSNELDKTCEKSAETTAVNVEKISTQLTTTTESTGDEKQVTFSDSHSLPIRTALSSTQQRNNSKKDVDLEENLVRNREEGSRIEDRAKCEMNEEASKCGMTTDPNASRNQNSPIHEKIDEDTKTDISKRHSIVDITDPAEQDESWLSNSIRKKSIAQLGLQPKLSAIGLLADDMANVKMNEADEEASEEASPHERSFLMKADTSDSRKVSFVSVRPKTETKRVKTIKLRPSKQDKSSSLPQLSASTEDHNYFDNDDQSAIDQIAFEQATSNATIFKPLKKQLRPPLGLRAKVRKPSSTRILEDAPLIKTNTKSSRSIRPLRSSTRPSTTEKRGLK